MNLRLVILIGVLGVLAAACQPESPAKAPPPGGPQTWIDAPLDNAALPLEPYEVISHATNPKGIGSFELSVNGIVQQTSPLGAGQVGEKFAMAKFNWNPPAPGVYLLKVRAADATNNFGTPAEARVLVGEEPTPIATRIAPIQPTVPATFTPTRPSGLTQPQPSPTRTQPPPGPPTATRTPTFRLIIPPGLFRTPTPTLVVPR